MGFDLASEPARAEPAPSIDPPNGAVYGALDIGTNSCRLLVARSNGQVGSRENGTEGPEPAFRVVDAYSRVVCLGEGLDASNRLSEAAMDRAAAALRVCAGKLRQRRVRHVRAVATEACRRATNRLTFCARVKRETGIGLEVISKAEEVELALTGCLPLLEPARRHALVFDIGGGSTQVSWLELAADRAEGPAGGGGRASLRAWHSIPFGVVGLSERYGGDAVSAAAFERMVAEVRAALAPFEAAHGLGEKAKAGRMQMLGTSGTATTLAGIHRGLRRYRRDLVDGQRLRRDTAVSLARRIAAMSYRERADIACIGRERAKFVIGGCAILDAICSTWPVGALRVADRGLREGILHNLMRKGEGSGVVTAPGASGGP